MPATRHVPVSAGNVLVLVGTTKGLFLFASDAKRTAWRAGGPYFPGQAVYAAAYDGRGRRRIWAAPESSHWGSALQFSDDFGKRWNDVGLRFPEGTDASLTRVWQIKPGPSAKKDTLYCGVEPAALFESHDAGASWSLVRGLYDHPHRPRWQPGGGGLGLHTILSDDSDPRRIYVAISTGGVYRSDDGGRVWRTAHKGVRAEFLPGGEPEFGQCVHKVVRHPDRPDRLFLQNHWGLYRSEDGGDSWQDMAKGVPSDFGFAMAVHAHEPATVYIVPLESDTFRCTPAGKLRVYRTRNAGRSWQALTRGLAQKEAHETVLRDALATDPLPKAGIYFGTRSGKLFASKDSGDSWRGIADGLPPVLCVRTAVIEKAPRRT